MLSCPRCAHRASHLPERQDCERMQPSQVAANDRLGALQIALEDLDTEVSRFESEIDAVRQREDRDRSLLQSVADAKQLWDLQHELETLQRRQSSLEDSLLEVMEHREQLQAQRTAELAAIEALQADLACSQHALDSTLADIEHVRRLNSSRREELIAALDPELVALYERQRVGGGPGRPRCRAVAAGRAGSRSTAARCPGSPRPPRTKCCGVPNVAQSCCGSKAQANEGPRRGRRRIPRKPGTGGLRVGGLDRRPVDRAGRKQAGNRVATNNVAEYRGLIAGLEEAAELHATEVAVSMDSKLVVEQMSGRWQVKHPDLKELNATARALASQFERISYQWIPRAENSHADRLANEAMDAAAEQPAHRPIPCPQPPSTRHPRAARVDRCERHRNPTAVAASRPDRIVGAAALLRTRQSRP